MHCPVLVMQSKAGAIARVEVWFGAMPTALPSNPPHMRKEVLELEEMLPLEGQVWILQPSPVKPL
jgi:hypothetical protein